jgi:hypothetical protein
LISSPLNECQRQFNELCKKGGGRNGGPARTKVQQLLRDEGKLLNGHAYDEVASALDVAARYNPWYIFFALGLCWGEMARYSDRYLLAAVGAIESWNDQDRGEATKHYTQKGHDLLEGSLRSASVVFEQIGSALITVPDSVQGYDKLQEKWFRRLHLLTPPYVGPWNATALFMVALFAQPDLAKSMKTMRPILPSGGPISRALSLIHQVGVTNHPAQTLQDDYGLGGLAGATADNGTMQELIIGLSDCSMVDMHSGLYMLGSRDPKSDMYFQ